MTAFLITASPLIARGILLAIASFAIGRKVEAMREARRATTPMRRALCTAKGIDRRNDFSAGIQHGFRLAGKMPHEAGRN